ncbi:amidohydrolase family protein [Acidithiobacillus thiooxidans]|uniref:amidohydrolase family protein n=1 Tax=Acidithiobacillus thiooxidans TaxID=930 RepID=UPI001C065632|nr:amidohydrolase family protein [Acidithiobacillus thiooxidans]MBU2749780.1 amidohydrolase family protein [Acidithiobacillus thiooxidans]
MHKYSKNLNKVIYRASIVNPINSSRCSFYKDGGLLIDNGVIEEVNCFDNVLKNASPDVPVIELNGVISPGFVDVHLHWVQYKVKGLYSGELLTWLRESIWPEESHYVDVELATSAARNFYDDLLRAGTVMGLSYSSPHAHATQIAIDLMRGDWVVGNVLMGINAPNYLTDFSLHDSDTLKAFMSNIDLRHYAVTPRFAPNLSQFQLKALGEIAIDSGVIIQTHLAESREEVEWVRKLFPEADNYTDVYDRAGLLGRKTVLGHCIEMSDSEWRCLAERGCWVAHCPTSNEALGNRRMPLEKLREYNIPYALATDIGAGPSHSMLHVLQRFLSLHRDAGVNIDHEDALYRATLAGAEAMGRGLIAGNLCAGKRADFILLPGMGPRDHWAGWLEDCISGSMSELETRPLGTWLGGKKVS